MLNRDLLQCLGTTFKYFGATMNIKLDKFCVIPIFSRNVCKKTLNIPISVRLELLNRTWVRIKMYGYVGLLQSVPRIKNIMCDL